MNIRRILMLGGTDTQIPAIQKAKKMGLYVITCDNRPDNPGHLYSDEYYNVSITDNDAILTLAKELNVDAVVNYALEAGIQAAAYTQEKLCRPTSPYKSVHTLSNKKLFRQFLKDNGFSVPRVYAPDDKDIVFPVVVKPTDLWGSRGFSKVERREDLQKAIDYAMQNSLKDEVIIEEFIKPWYSAIEGDGFAVNGKLTAHLWGDCYPDAEAPNSETPVLYIFPSEKPQPMINKFNGELQRLMNLLQMKTNAYNVEARFDDKGNVYLMEVAPRNGGNALTDVLELATGIDTMTGTIRATIGDDCNDITDTPCKGYWCNYVVHSNAAGIFDGIWFDDDFRQNNFVSYAPYLNIGDKVMPYTGTNCSIGMLIAKFPDRDSQHVFMRSPESFFKVRLK